MKLMSVRSIELLGGFQARLGFDDGTEKVVDLEIYLRGPIFEPVRSDPEVFRSVRVDNEAGTIIWPNGADIDPNVLYYDHLKPAWMEDEATHKETAQVTALQPSSALA
jgi:hypothetical protein